MKSRERERDNKQLNKEENKQINLQKIKKNSRQLIFLSNLRHCLLKNEKLA